MTSVKWLKKRKRTSLTAATSPSQLTEASLCTKVKHAMLGTVPYTDD